MSLHRPTLAAFLSAARKALTAPPAQRPAPLTFVLGNESADLDSLCSALLLAYLRSGSHLHIPLSNLPRADLALRPELAAVLRRAGLRPDDLLTLSDLPADLGPATRWLLVDHNLMTGELGRRLRDRVVGCVDHHEDEGVLGPEPEAGEPRIIRRCGSCMSLVVEYAREAWGGREGRGVAGGSGGKKEGAAGGGEDQALLDAQLAHVALGPILIDTTNLTSKEKTTDTDAWAVEYAEECIRRAGLSYDRTRYFDEITALKGDLSGLDYRDVFRKDYKEWTDGGLTLGTCSVAQGIEYLLEKIGASDQFLSELKKWSEERKLDIVAVMTTLQTEGKFSRELLVWALNGDAVRAVKAFTGKNMASLGLEPWHDGELDETSGGDEWRMAWRQSRIEHSRKQIAPMLRSAMKQPC